MKDLRAVGPDTFNMRLSARFDYSAPTGLKIRVLTLKQGDALLYVLPPLT
jgi:hypothetical protein